MRSMSSSSTLNSVRARCSVSFVPTLRESVNRAMDAAISVSACASSSKNSDASTLCRAGLAQLMMQEQSLVRAARARTLL